MTETIFRAIALLRREPLATGVGLFFLAMTLPTLLALALDGRTVHGNAVWLKPLKFELSLAVHVLTVVLALGALDRRVARGRAARVALGVLLAMSLLEFAWIAAQAGRGVPSHFATSPFDTAMYVLAGFEATLIVLATGLLGLLTLRHPAPGVPRLVSRAVGIGLLVSGVTGLVTGWAISLNNGVAAALSAPP